MSDVVDLSFSSSPNLGNYVEVIRVSFDSYPTNSSVDVGCSGTLCAGTGIYNLHRELFSPTRFSSLIELLAFHNCDADNFDIYLRDFNTNLLRSIDVSYTISPRISIFLVDNTITSGQLDYVVNELIGKTRELYTSRMS